MFKRRITTFINGLRSMRPFIGRRVPCALCPATGGVCPPNTQGPVTGFDESFWGFGPVYRSQPGGHFHFMFFAFFNRKIGFYDTN